MFILDSQEMKSEMFARGHRANADLELCHKRIGHINLQKLKGMQTKRVYIGLPIFTEKEITADAKPTNLANNTENRSKRRGT